MLIVWRSTVVVAGVASQHDWVYIGAQSGAVSRGRGQQWTLIHRGDMTLPFQNLV